jgi:hypothetical protein
LNGDEGDVEKSPLPRPPAARPPTSPAPPAAGAPASPLARDAGLALLALARAARSLVLYDERNAAVRQFLNDYRDRMRAALAHGAMRVEVQPFDLVVDGEVAYHDKDRERSLAFRLFRDGVRRFAVEPGVPEEELLSLLEILAVRCAGVRQQEEDLATVLQKISFTAVTFGVVEGFTPAEESPEPELDEPARRARRAAPPPGWDLPLKKLPAPAPLEWRDVPAEALAPLRAEEEDVDGLALSVARDLLAEAQRAGWSAENADLVAFFSEVRDGLLADGRLVSLKRLVDLIGDAGTGELRDAMLRGLGDPRTLDLVLAAVPPGARQLPRELVPFLPLLGTDAILDRLMTEEPPSRQSLLVGLAVARVPREASAVLARVPRLPPALASELAAAVVARAPERSVEVARQLLALPHEPLRLEGLSVLERAPGEVPLRPVYDLLRDRSRAVRIRAAEVVGRRGDNSAIDPLTDALAEDRVDLAEAEVLGRALGEAAPVAAAPLLAEWLEPRARFLVGVSSRARTLQWAAVAGTGALPGAEAERALASLAERSDGELRRHCLATLARRKRAGAHARP